MLPFILRFLVASLECVVGSSKIRRMFYMKIDVLTVCGRTGEGQNGWMCVYSNIVDCGVISQCIIKQTLLMSFDELNVSRMRESRYAN